MNKKQLNILFTTAFMLLTSCGSSHHFNEDWTSDNNGHWHTCKDDGCEEKGSYGEHTYDDGKITVNPTCTSIGVKTFTCTVCEHTYTEDVAKTDHVKAANPSFDDDYHWYNCTGCGEQLEKTHHHFDDGVVSKKATCTERGVTTFTCSDCGFSYTEGIVPEGHKTGDWEKDSDYHWKTCATCNEQVEKSSHAAVGGYKLDDNYHWKVCECGEILDKSSHVMDWKVKTPASYSSAGEEEGTCTACGKKDTREIPQLKITAKDVETKINALPRVSNIKANTKQALAEIEELLTMLAAGETVSEACMAKLNTIRQTYETTYEVAYSMNKEDGASIYAGDAANTTEYGLVDSTYGTYSKTTFNVSKTALYIERVDRQFAGQYESITFYAKSNVTFSTFFWTWANDAWSHQTNVSFVKDQWVEITLNKAFVQGVYDTKPNPESKRSILFWKSGESIPEHCEMQISDIYGIATRTTEWGQKFWGVSNAYDGSNYNTNRWNSGQSVAEAYQRESSPYGPVFGWKNFTKETDTFTINQGPMDSTDVLSVHFAYFAQGNFKLEAKTSKPSDASIMNEVEVKEGWNVVTLTAGSYQFKSLIGENGSFETWYFKATAGLTSDSVFEISGFWVTKA